MKTLFTLLLFSFIGFNTTAQAADLQVSSRSVNNGTLPSNAVSVPFLDINLRSTNGTTEVKSLLIERQGLSSSEDIGRVWAETSTYRRTNKRQFTNDDQVELSFRNPLVVNNNETVQITVYANLNFSGGGRTIRFNLADINHNGTAVAPPAVQITTPSRIPTVTATKAPYDRTRFRIKCVNRRCGLVPRN